MQIFLILVEEIKAPRSDAMCPRSSSRRRAELGLDPNVLMPNVPSTRPQLLSEYLLVQDQGCKSAGALRLIMFKYLTI